MYIQVQHLTPPPGPIGRPKKPQIFPLPLGTGAGTQCDVSGVRRRADQRRPLLPQGFLVAAGMWVNRVPVWKTGVGLSNCLLTSKPRLLRGLMVLPLQVAFPAAVACLRKRER